MATTGLWSVARLLLLLFVCCGPAGARDATSSGDHRVWITVVDGARSRTYVLTEGRFHAFVGASDFILVFGNGDHGDRLIADDGAWVVDDGFRIDEVRVLADMRGVLAADASRFAAQERRADLVAVSRAIVFLLGRDGEALGDARAGIHESLDKVTWSWRTERSATARIFRRP